VDVSVIKTIIFEAVVALRSNAKAHSQSCLTGSVVAIPLGEAKERLWEPYPDTEVFNYPNLMWTPD